MKLSNQQPVRILCVDGDSQSLERLERELSVLPGISLISAPALWAGKSITHQIDFDLKIICANTINPEELTTLTELRDQPGDTYVLTDDDCASAYGIAALPKPLSVFKIASLINRRVSHEPKNSMG